MLKLGVTGAAGAALIGAPVDVKLATPPGLWTPGVGMLVPRFTLAGAQDVNGVPTYILPPIIVTPPYGSIPEDFNYGGGISSGGMGQSQFGAYVYQAVLRQKAIAAQKAQQQAIADAWNALYADWLLQFGPDASRLATELQWKGLTATQVIATVGVLEAAAGAIEAGGYLLTNKGTWSFIGESMRAGGLIATIAGLSVGFYVVLSGVAALAIGLGLIYIVVTRMNTAEVGTNYVGLRPAAVPDGSADIIIEAP
jgi:hypothetical protein